MDMQEFTGPEIIEAVRKWGNLDDSPEAAAWLWETLTKMNLWLERGDGIAVYENQDLSHSELGDKRFVSFGSSAAQLETDTPPKQLPDTNKSINWRYQLIGTYKGDRLSF
ncbi:hypothetical protein [Streptomyces sp. NPDC017448]|uniref:hypothetical protein n=1 Tax=Streptomyces sp. NPDC017448 TaxID=3364996 RepID=UPI00379571D5